MVLHEKKNYVPLIQKIAINVETVIFERWTSVLVSFVVKTIATTQLLAKHFNVRFLT